MFKKLVLTSAIAILIGAATIWLSGWLSQEIEQPYLEIRGPQVPDLAQPVYAQFSVTQTLTIPEPMTITRLAVPLYVADTVEPLVVELHREKKLVSRWRLQPKALGQNKVVTMPLPLHPPRSLDGRLELNFTAPTIPVADKNHAPRLFIETADAAYPGGSYRIAENPKQGDVRLTVFEQHPRRDLLGRQWHEQPLAAFSAAVRWLLAGLVLVSLPGVLLHRRSQLTGRRP